MTKANDQIKSGILFEEDIVHVLAEDIKLMKGYIALDEIKQEEVQRLLNLMIKDSNRHRELLRGIVDRY